MSKEECLVCMIIIFILAICGYIYYEKEGFQLKCIVSNKDGNEYCVRERSKVKEAADLLASVSMKCIELVEYMKSNHPDNAAVKRLVDGYNPDKIKETLPTSKYTLHRN